MHKVSSAEMLVPQFERLFIQLLHCPIDNLLRLLAESLVFHINLYPLLVKVITAAARPEDVGSVGDRLRLRCRCRLGGIDILFNWHFAFFATKCPRCNWVFIAPQA